MPAENRTEKPTPRRREDARKRGQVARSPDLSGSLVLLVGLFAVTLTGPRVVQTLAAFMSGTLALISRPQVVLTAAGLHHLLNLGLTTVAWTVGPIAGACVLTGVLGNMLQVGGRPRPQALRLDVKRISPRNGAKNLFGPNAIFETAKAMLKIAVVGAIAGISLIPNVSDLASKVGITPLSLGATASSEALAVAQRATFAYLVIGIIDYVWRRRRNERSLRMTKQEVRDEERRYTIAAEVKQALRRRQLQMARARMMAAVPKADVVVTNPTHVAVALGYDGSKAAPEVLAKGQELVAAQIRRVAEEHGVPIVADPPLARSLYASTEIGVLIPAELYVAVARVLAFVYRVARRRSSSPARALIPAGASA